jgi:hypothetical protein
MMRAMPADFAPLEPHGPLTPLFEDVFTLVGSVTMMPLVRIPRTMTVVRRGSELTLINAVRVDDATLTALKALGRIAHVVRIGLHGMDDAWYVQEHGATLWALPGVEHARGQTTQEELAEDHLPLAGARLFRFEHTVAPEAALLLDDGGGLLVTCDSVQNWESTDGCSLLGTLATHALGFLVPAQIGPPWRKRMTPPGGSLRPDFERLADLPFKHLVGGHGVPLRGSANAALRATIERVYG